jgi:hypothetical protein
VAITYGASPTLSNFFDQLDTIKSAGNFNVPMKLPPPPKIKIPVAPLGGVAIGPGMSRSPGGKVTTQGQHGPSGGTLEALRRAIEKQESGGNYSARNSMYGAAGAYQILPSNFTQVGSGWDMEALGHDVSLAQFMASPAIQDAIAKYKLNQYLKQYKSAAAAAVAWYGGPGAVSHMYDRTSQAGGYPSLYAYWKSVLSKM